MIVRKLEILADELRRRGLPVDPILRLLPKAEEKERRGWAVDLKIRRLGPEMLDFTPYRSEYSWSGGDRWGGSLAVLVLKDGREFEVRPEVTWSTGSGESGRREGETVAECMIRCGISPEDVAYLLVVSSCGCDWEDIRFTWEAEVYLRPRVEELKQELEKALAQLRAEIAASVEAALGE